MTCTYPECDCAISFPDGYKPSEATECPRIPMDAGTSRPALPGEAEATVSDARKALESARDDTVIDAADEIMVWTMARSSGPTDRAYWAGNVRAAIDAALASGEQGWGQFARAICESEGREWLALDNPREDCERWIKAGQACAAIAAPPAAETRT